MGRLKHLVAIVALISGLSDVVSPAIPAQETRTEILVTNKSDDVNGDVSNADALMANAGKDGISLREAIHATNNDPGLYTIRFDPALSGRTIRVEPESELPALLGGGVTIEGDIDGDDRPDVTLRGDGEHVGFSISSSNNRLRSVKLSSFQLGVVLQPPLDPLPTGRVFADNTVSGLVMTGIGKWGIGLDPTGLGSCGVPCKSRNTWASTLIKGNRIESKSAGIFFWNSSTGERVKNVTITDNEVTITGRATGSGIALETAGPLGGAESTDAVISDVRIARNSVRGSPDVGIGVTAGTGRSQHGMVQQIRVVNNRVELAKTGSCFCCRGIVVQAGSDSPEFAKGPPVRYLDDNVVRDVVVRGNSITGSVPSGINVLAGDAGGRRNRIRDVRIKENVVRSGSAAFGALVVIGGIRPYKDRYAEENRISHVSISGNRFRIRTREFAGAGDPGTGEGGVVVAGGWPFARNNRIRYLRISGNSIKTVYVGINIQGGQGSTSSGNRVTCIRLVGNRIRGTRTRVSVLSNVQGATGNIAKLGGC